MKNKKLLNITILSSIIFFSACSNKQESITKENTRESLSVYNIMGITEPMPIHSYTPPVKTRTSYMPQDNFVQDIEYISYRQPTPVINHFQTIANVESNAKSLLGTPYVWGATGPNKFDCSGFTQWVFRDVGINIPRVSKDQARVGQFISFNNLQRGDMMFFDTHKKRTGKVTHVGIYLGDGNFIHASSAGKKVVIYNFNQKTFYKKRFLWGRRVINNNFHYASN